MSKVANSNTRGVRGDDVEVVGVVVDLNGGVSLGVCTICRNRVFHGAHTADNGQIAVEPNHGCGHVFHHACLRSWFNYLGGLSLLVLSAVEHAPASSLGLIDRRTIGLNRLVDKLIV